MSPATDSPDVSRRVFLKKAAQGGAGLSLAFMFSGCIDKNTAQVSESVVASFEANAFVTITSDNKVIVLVPKLEMGQGTYTGLATVVAEELDA
ncbi:molybdopterin-dependent oxidoreductase, partial [Porticoccaceae bacterium]|nr:molybdopterin-dependent oxidoreductase [Porticoccaceae bacterium]